MKRFLLFIILLLSFSFAIDANAKLEILDITSSVKSEYYQWKEGPEGNAIYQCYSGYTFIARKDGKELVTAMSSAETIELKVEGLKEGYYNVVLKAKISSNYNEPITVYSQVGEQERADKKLISIANSEMWRFLFFIPKEASQ